MRYLTVTVIAIFLSIFVTVEASSQNLEDVVYLKNGSIIRGIITELIPNEPVKIQTRGGSVFVCELDEILKIVKESRRTTITDPSSDRLPVINPNQPPSIFPEPELKSPVLATGLSFLVPGFGQLYLGQGRRGGGYIAGWFIGLVLFVNGSGDKYGDDLDQVSIMGAFMMLGSWGSSMYDAYRDANIINQEYRQRLQGHLIQLNHIGIDPIVKQEAFGARLTLRW